MYSLRYISEGLLKMSRLTDVFLYLFSGTDNFCLIHVSLVPVLNVVGEQASFLTFENLFHLFGIVVLIMSNSYRRLNQLNIALET